MQQHCVRLTEWTQCFIIYLLLLTADGTATVRTYDINIIYKDVRTEYGIRTHALAPTRNVWVTSAYACRSARARTLHYTVRVSACVRRAAIARRPSYVCRARYHLPRHVHLAVRVSLVAAVNRWITCKDARARTLARTRSQQRAALGGSPTTAPRGPVAVVLCVCMCDVCLCIASAVRVVSTHYTNVTNSIEYYCNR